MRDPKQKVLSYISEKDIVDLAREIISIPSVNPPGEVVEISRFLGRQLKDIGLNVRETWKIPEKRNLIGTIKGKGPQLLFCGHMDTVPVTETERELWSVDPFAGAVKNGKVYGKGSVDMKGGIASLIVAVNALQQADVQLERDLMVASLLTRRQGEWRREVSGLFNQASRTMLLLPFIRIPQT